MVRDIRVNLRLNKREFEMLEFIKKVSGSNNYNEAARYAIKFTYEALKKTHGE